MDHIEFVVILTERYNLGKVFLPCLIRKKDKFFTVEKQVKLHDINQSEYEFKPYERELVEIMDKYSDEKLMKRFSKTKNSSEFRKKIIPELYERQILPFLESCMFKVVTILMVSPVRLINKEAKYANLYDDDEIQVSPFFAQPVFYFYRNDTETRYKLRVWLDDQEVPLQNRNINILTNKPCTILRRNVLIAFEKLDAKKLNPFFSKEFVSIPHSIEDKYYGSFVKKIVRDFDVRAEGFTIEDGQSQKFASLTLEYNLEWKPALTLRYHYENEVFYPNTRQEVAVRLQKNESHYFFRKTRRDYVWEAEVAGQVKLAGLVEMKGYYTLPGAPLIDSRSLLYDWMSWLSKNMSFLEQQGIRVKQDKLDKNYFIGNQEIELDARMTDDWFDVFARVTFGGFTFPFIKLKNHILNDQREFELPNGEIAIIPEEWFARYKSLASFARSKGLTLHLEKHHYALIKPVLQSGNKSVIHKINQLSGFREKVSLPEGLNAQLRNYQVSGFRWMHGLKRNRFGGCLADDMGLGKTLQTLTLLLKFKRSGMWSLPGKSQDQSGQLTLFADAPTGVTHQPASMIILPTSLVHNWESEIYKFTPSLKIYKHAGAQRKGESGFENALHTCDIILTTYGTVRNDCDMLSRHKFFFLILDESQYVKNASSKTYKAIMKLRGEHRLALTGTPIENSLSDLWAQMNFLNKGLLGNLPFFKRFFLTPIEKNNDKNQQEKLQILIRPFILRRTKEEVAHDLPPVTEQVIFCEMEEKQKHTYEKEKSIIRNSILAGIENDGVKKSAMIVLKGLTRLRQLANHPLMLDDMGSGESGKYEEIISRLESVVAENHKVLVFSSFVKHLKLIVARLEKKNWKYSLLTGQTGNRAEVIKQFQEDPENRIFLISLKAGGVGLNLTGADYVFILDPWWNPAAENQAISRAHRIGQSRPVFVYRFISRGSVEEKIQQLQDRKNSLANIFINSNNPLQEITKEEILNLLK